MSSEAKEEWLVCLRAEECQPKVKSLEEKCSLCGALVWRAVSSPSVRQVACLNCVVKMVNESKGEGFEIAIPIQTQIEDIKRGLGL